MKIYQVKLVNTDAIVGEIAAKDDREAKDIAIGIGYRAFVVEHVRTETLKGTIGANDFGMLSQD